MADLEAFRGDVRRWLDANAPAGAARARVIADEGDGNWGGRRAVFDPPEMKTWLERDGGARLDRADLAARVRRRRALVRRRPRCCARSWRAQKLPPPLIGFGLEMIGPTLLRYGTEAQKRQHIPAIVRGEIRWCQGYSEPDSGSDLASLKTRAVRARRPLPGERHQGLDLLRRPLRLDLRPGAHRSRPRRSRTASPSC